MATWSFNKGEWTEAYVFLRLLGDGRIYGASANLKKDLSTYIDILNIIRDEPKKLLIFERDLSDPIAKVKVLKDEKTIQVVTAPELSHYAKILYEGIKELKTENKVFPEIQAYLESMSIDTPKSSLSDSAKEKYGKKTDIIIESRNSTDNTTSTEGFSIKSHLGSSATLFNCSQTSGFTYEIPGCNETMMHQLNAKDSLLSIISGIKDFGGRLEYVKCRNEIFEQNICIVDSQMDRVLSSAVLAHVGYYTESAQSGDVKDICEFVILQNPVGVKNPESFYPAKFKDFLFASFAGLTASTAWNGRKMLSGGYIDVSRDGEMLYYRAISDEIFGNYLFKNTYFDRPDRGWCKDLALAKAKAFLEHTHLTNEEMARLTYKNGKDGARKSKKGDFGYIYEHEGKYYMDLNFQIRFR